MRGTSNIFAFIAEILIACLKQNYEMNYAFGYVLLTNFVITTIRISTSISVLFPIKAAKTFEIFPKQHLFCDTKLIVRMGNRRKRGTNL